MYDGWWVFNGDEVINHARTQAYLDDGLAPPGSGLTTADAGCESLVDVLNGGRAYTSPVTDNAPWVESNNPDSWDFAGIIALDMSGVSGSTRNAEVVQFAGDGGTTSRVRYGTRTIAVSALLVGRTGAGVEAGLSWLTTVLAGDEGAGTGGELCGMVACPEDYSDVALLDEAPVTETVDRRIDGWKVTAGRFRSSDGWFDPNAPEPDQVGRYGSGYFGFSVYGAHDLVTEPYLTAAPQQCYAGPVTWAWNLKTQDGAAVVSYGAMDETGKVLARTPTATLQGDYLLQFTPDPMWETWVPVLWVSGNPVKVTPTITHVPYLTAEQCADSYVRSYLDVTTVSGPEVVQTVSLGDCGEYALKVEWTWVVGNPFMFGSITPLVAGFSTAGALPATYERGVVPLTVGTQKLTGVNACAVDDSEPFVIALYDPCCPAFVPPPKPPQIADACWTAPNSWRRWAFTVPRRVIPVNEAGMLTVVFTNDSRPKRGVRLRVYPDPLGRGWADLEECAFCVEFNLTYVPPNAVLTLDGTRRRVTTALPGMEPVITSGSVRGRDGGSFDYPSISCDTPQVVVLDVPDNYDQACGGYAVGAAQGDLTFDLSIRPAVV